MIRTIGKFKEVSIVCLALAVLAPGFAAGQQGKGGSSTDELLKSIGSPSRHLRARRISI